MKVCDFCKDIHKPCFEVRVIVVKTEEKRGGKVSDRDLITVPMDLCEDDITNLNRAVRRMVENVRNEVQSSPPEFTA